MNPLGNRARAEELARLLEGAMTGATPGTAGYGALAARLRAAAPALQDATPLRPEFRTALRQRLVAVATVQGPAAVAAPAAVPGANPVDRVVAWSRTWTAQKRIAVASGAMAGVVAVTGVAVASSRSLPGQPFYGLKRASEGVELRFADGDTAKGTKHLEFAATRLREVRALARGEGELALAGSGAGTEAAGLAASVQERINDTLADFRSETTEGRVLLEGVYRSTGKTAPLRVLTTFASQQKSRLSAIIPELPAGTANSAQESLDLVSEVGSTAGELLAIGTCGESCNPDAGGPVLPVEPLPTPGTSASPEQPDDDNGVPPCECVEPSTTPEPTTEPTESPSPEPTTSQPTPTSTPTPTPSPTSTGGLPLPLPTVLPTVLPTILPTLLPPLPIPTELPTLLPGLPDLGLKP